MPTEHEPLLLTPGPLTTSRETKEAMLRDWGSRDAQFIALNARVRARLLAIAGAEGSHVCVPVQGSGTFAIEATVGNGDGHAQRRQVGHPRGVSGGERARGAD